MSAWPGYQSLIAKYGVDTADRIIDSAEHYSDAACKPWAEAIRWAEHQHLNPPSKELAAQQARNAALHADMVRRRGDVPSRPITYLVHELPGDAFAYPANLQIAEELFDAHSSTLGLTFSVGEAMEWARRVARELPEPDSRV